VTGKLLLTGASGFLGRHVLEALRRRQPARALLALVRDRAAWQELDWVARLGALATIEGSVEDADAALAADPRLAGTDTILHLAGGVRHTRRDTNAMARTNVAGTLAMVRLAGRLGARLVFVSSSGTVGCFRHSDVVADEDSPFASDTAGRWPYYASKIEAEIRAAALARKLGVELVIARPPILLGPGDHRFRSTGWVARVMLRAVPALPEGGVAFADVRDVAKSLAAIAAHASPRLVYHLHGTHCSTRAFFRMCEEVSAGPPPRIAPFGLLYGLSVAADRLATALSRPSWLPDPVVIEMAAHHWAVTSLHAGRDLGHAPRPPRQTLSDTVAWLRAHHPKLAGARA
jgi:nucleoside-diphosphate-sugar epimerase